MTRRTGGQAVVDVMAREGVRRVFCVPGESYLGVLDALYDHDAIQLISNRHEGGAAFMADAYAKVSGEVGVCMATRGVGASNLTIGVHTAYQDSTPMVVLLGDIEREFEYREAFQEVDLPAFFKPISKWSIEIRDARRIPELLHRAFHVARSGRPGPVVVSLAHDMLADELDLAPAAHPTAGAPAPYRTGCVCASTESIDEALTMLQAAQRPVVLVGGGVLRSGATDTLVAVAERLHLPVVTAFRRFDAFPNQHPCYAGWLGYGPQPALLSYMHNADVALVLGTRLSQVTTQDYTLFGPDTRLIHVDISPDVFGKSYPPTLFIVSDAEAFLQGIQARAVGHGTPDRETTVQALHDAYIAFSRPRQDYADTHVDLDGLMHDFIEHGPSDAIITSDAGNFFGWLVRYYKFNRPGTYVGPTSGAMGYGLPSAIGAKLARPDLPVVTFAGDGGFLMTCQELETAVRYDVPIVAIVVNNGLYGTIRAHQARHFPGRTVGTVLGNPDFAAMARSFGAHGERVHRNADFVPALQRALAAGKPAVIEVLSNAAVLSVNHPKG